MFVMMIGNNLFGLLFAFILSSLKKGKKLFLALLFWPSLVSAVVGSNMTLMIFGSESSSLANVIVGWFGVDPIHWFDQESTALLGLMIQPFFLGFCGKMLIYYASIIQIPKEFIDAATLDTNSKVKIFSKVKLPLMKNALVLNLVLSLIDGLKVLGPMQLVTKGANGTTSTLFLIYQTAFEKGQMGLASSYAFILFGIILVFSILQLKLSGGDGETIE
jgi:ABC-type sugar transport system permease subunit